MAKKRTKLQDYAWKRSGTIGRITRVKNQAKHLHKYNSDVLLTSEVEALEIAITQLSYISAAMKEGWEIWKEINKDKF